MRIEGRWREGFVIDYHTTSSLLIGHDEFGHPVFDTRRTEIGELLYRLKYKQDRSALEPLAEIVIDFIDEQIRERVDILAPVPPTLRARPVQPVLAVARMIAERRGPHLVADCVSKVKETPELKNVFDYDERVRILEGAYAVSQESLPVRACYCWTTYTDQARR